MTDFLSATLEIKAIGEGADAGTFTGYGAVYHSTDLVGDKLLPGVFADSLSRRRAEGRTLPMHFNHGLPQLNGERAIGRWSVLEEDDNGLRVEGKIAGMNTERGRWYYERLRDGAIPGLSIGFKVARGDASFPRTAGQPARIVRRAELVEVSIVDDPAHPHARVLSVKSLADVQAVQEIEEFKARLARGDLPTEREVERLLRDAVGFSRAQAATIVGHGYKSLARESNAAGQTKPEVLDAVRNLRAALDGFSLPTLRG